MADNIDYKLRPLADRLRARYPGVRIVEASMSSTDDGMPQQNVRYQAPLAWLKQSGLVTAEMLRLKQQGRSDTALGEGFSLCRALDDESRDGFWDLSVYTGTCPRERDRMAMTEAKRLLRQIARANKDISRAKAVIAAAAADPQF